MPLPAEPSCCCQFVNYKLKQRLSGYSGVHMACEYGGSGGGNMVSTFYFKASGFNPADRIPLAFEGCWYLSSGSKEELGLVGTREMAQQLRALTAPADYSASTWLLTTICDSRSRGTGVLFCTLWTHLNQGAHPLHAGKTPIHRK